MRNYRLHDLKRDRSITKRSVLMKCYDDDEAVRQAKQLT
jgi:hypothetical protein